MLQAARELNYRPSLLARSLRTNLSQTIGLLSDVIATEAFAGEIIRGSMATALLHEHLMFIGETEGDPEVEKRLVQSMLDRGVGGFVYAVDVHPERPGLQALCANSRWCCSTACTRGKTIPGRDPGRDGEAGRSAAAELAAGTVTATASCWSASGRRT